MTPLPDNFNPSAFDAFLGTAATDRIEDEATTRANATIATNRKAAAILARARAEIIALGFFDLMANGYDLVEALEVMRDIAPKPDDPREVARVMASERGR